MNIITVFEKTTKDVANSYDIIVGTGIIFDKTNKLVLNCTDDVDEKQWSDESLTFDIDGKEVTFYIIEKTSYDTIKDIAEVIRIQEMEHDLNYMKSQEQHGNSCVGCHAEQGNVKVEPCKSCKDYCNYKSNSMLSDCCSAPIRYLDCEDCKKKGVPCPIVICTQCGATIHDHTDEQAAEIQDNVRYDDQHKVIPTDPETLDNTIKYKPTGKLDKEIKCTTMNDICGPLKETFGKYVGPILMNDIHNKSIKHIKFIIDYLWANELKAFQEYTEYVIQSQDNLQSWIDVCENYIMTHDNLETSKDPVNHVFYHLMKLKKLYNL